MNDEPTAALQLFAVALQSHESPEVWDLKPFAILDLCIERGR